MLTTERLLLRHFTETDIPALYDIYKDEEVNRFLPWFPLKSLEEARLFFKERYERIYCQESGCRYAVCLKEYNIPIGYVHVGLEGGHDFGYGLRKEFWHQGIATEAAAAVLEQLKKDGISFVTATHDVKNPRSGRVMKRLGMTYRYSYEEQWQPKDIPVIFRMYQMNLDGQNDRVYKGYWEKYPVHFVERDLDGPGNLVFRDYVPSDCEKMAELFYETVHSVNAKDYTGEQLYAWATGKVDQEQWNRSFSEHHTVVAAEGDRIVGFGDMDEHGYLDRLYVHKDYQGRGIGTSICEKLESGKAGAALGGFYTHASITARPFFECRGYRVVREQQVERNGILLTNYVMEKVKGAGECMESWM